MIKTVFFCSAFSEGKVKEMYTFATANEVNIYIDECRKRGLSVEHARINIPVEDKQKKHEVQYVPPPSWGGRVVCVETGWIFKTISAAARTLNGNQWALRKAILRNTIYHGYHWRMYGDTAPKIDKFT